MTTLLYIFASIGVLVTGMILFYLVLDPIYFILKDLHRKYVDRMFLGNLQMTRDEFDKWIMNCKVGEIQEWHSKNSKFYHSLVHFKCTEFDKSKLPKEVR